MWDCRISGHTASLDLKVKGFQSCDWICLWWGSHNTWEKTQSVLSSWWPLWRLLEPHAAPLLLSAQADGPLAQGQGICRLARDDGFQGPTGDRRSEQLRSWVSQELEWEIRQRQMSWQGLKIYKGKRGERTKTRGFQLAEAPGTPLNLPLVPDIDSLRPGVLEFRFSKSLVSLMCPVYLYTDSLTQSLMSEAWKSRAYY